jgi:hypothetical protein
MEGDQGLKCFVRDEGVVTVTGWPGEAIQVALVGVELEPHRLEVAQLEQHVALLPYCPS